MSNDRGGGRIVDISRNYFAPQVAAFIYRGVVCPLHFRRTGPTADGYIREFDLIGRRAESEVQMGAGFAEACGAALRV